MRRSVRSAGVAAVVGLSLGLGPGLDLESGLGFDRGSAFAGAAADPVPAPLDAAAAERACREGAAASCTRLGLALRLGTDGVAQDIPRARRVLTRACELGQGRVPACTHLAEIVNSELAGPRDTGAALTILERACAGQEASACAFLGLIYVEGLGVPYNAGSQHYGARFYRKACELGHGGGCWHLGLLQRSGTGLQRDAAAARGSFTRACKLGETIGCDELKKP